MGKAAEGGRYESEAEGAAGEEGNAGEKEGNGEATKGQGGKANQACEEGRREKERDHFLKVLFVCNYDYSCSESEKELFRVRGEEEEEGEEKVEVK